MRTPFGADWEELGLDNLRTFLAEPRNEPLRWEAKGGRITPELVREAVCGFANSHISGFLILGVTQDRRTRSWSIDRWEPPDEVEVWVGNCIRAGGVDPEPAFEVKAWPVGDGAGWLGCVAIWPVAVPPAITSEGGVWVRTSGATPQVKDAATLRELVSRGEVARDRSLRLSAEAANDLYAAPPEGRANAVVAAASAPSIPHDISPVLFSESFCRGELVRSIQGELARYAAQGLQAFLRVHTDINQGSVTAWNDDGIHVDAGFSVRVGRHGSVAVGFGDPDIESGIDWARSSPNDLRRLFGQALTLLVPLGGRGPAHLFVRFTDRRLGVIDVARWTEVGDVDEAIVESVLRETRRAQGTMDWEPPGEGTRGA